MHYRIEEKEAFYVLEKVATHSLENAQNQTSVPEFWSKSYADGTMDTLSNFSSDENYIFGICYNGESKDAKTFDYSIAVKCAQDTVAPVGFRKTCIPSKTWLVFDCVGPMPNAIQDTWRKIASEFFPTSEYEPTYEMDIEAYTQGDMNAPDYRREIWVPVKTR